MENYQKAKDAYHAAIKVFQEGVRGSDDAVIQGLLAQGKFIDEEDPLVFETRFNAAYNQALAGTQPMTERSLTFARALVAVPGYREYLNSLDAYLTANEELRKFNESQKNIKKAAELRKQEKENQG